MTLEQRISALAAAIGADIKALGGAGPDISAIEALTGTGLIERTGDGTAAIVTITAAGKTLLDDIDAAAQRATLGLGNVDNTADANKPISSATQTALNLKAPLSSPELTGAPSAPTAAPSTNSTQIATTAFVQAAVSALIDASPGALDTLNELAAAIGDDPNFAATISNGLAQKLAKTLNLSDLADTAAARANLGLAIGTNVQAWDGDLAAIAALTGTTGLLKKTGANTWALDTGAYLTQSFPSGTSMLFVQTNAPVGWTKSVAHNDKALRVVSGSTSSGGTVGFRTAFASQAVNGSVGATTLTVAQIPSHVHEVVIQSFAGTLGFQVTSSNPGDSSWYSFSDSGSDGGGYHVTTPAGSNSAAYANYTGGGGSHTHSFAGTAINLDVQYVDTIIATKD